MGKALMKIATVYLIIGVGIGYYMSVAHSYELTGVHVHINLLGWGTMGLAGVFYYLFPKMEKSVWGKIHFWLHNIGLPIMMGSLAALILGAGNIYPLVATGATIVVLGLLAFLVNVFANLKE